MNTPSPAYQYFSCMRNIIVLVPLFGLLSSVFGILLSRQWDLPLGSPIVIVSVALFLISVAASPKRWRV
ncbi:MAG TPA: metal ABC transporter permease [Methanothrix sp.]|nr:metal ABC transporter permease [Methanothrix sp.]HPJ83812.1 metal ABC transporter permease [Methanothrix sp.]HPR66092.1 metal ABC transporter permease [Methanothrix sp.]